MFSMYFKNIPRWKILFSDPEYNKTKSNYEEIAFAFYSYAWIGGKKLSFQEKIWKRWRTQHVVVNFIRLPIFLRPSMMTWKAVTIEFCKIRCSDLRDHVLIR